MRIAIMQPYFMPYIGYFQLINAVDKFVIYNDVNYIKQGWINRNNILLNGTSFQFTIPLENASSFKKINETKLNNKLYGIWRDKFLKSLHQAYNRAPYYKKVSNMIINLMNQNYNYVCDLNVAAILEVCRMCNIDTEIIESSENYQNDYLKGEGRVIDICQQEFASVYVNAIGGKMIYDRVSFSDKKIKLQFLNSLPICYRQYNHDFVPNLSIIDLLMFADHNEINAFLNQYELI